jgi:hypothetical protein
MSLFRHQRRSRRIEVEHSPLQRLLLAPWRANDGEGRSDSKDVPLDGRTNGAASVRLGWLRSATATDRQTTNLGVRSSNLFGRANHFNMLAA